MNQDQLNSLVRSVLKIAGAILVAHGASKAAAIVNCEDMAGVVVSLVGLWLSHQLHGSPGNCRAVASSEGKQPVSPVAQTFLSAGNGNLPVPSSNSSLGPLVSSPVVPSAPDSTLARASMAAIPAPKPGACTAPSSLTPDL